MIVLGGWNLGEISQTVTTLALGSRPRQRLVRTHAKRSVRECEDEDSHC